MTQYTDLHTKKAYLSVSSSGLTIFHVSALAGSYQTLLAEQISYKFVCLPSGQIESFVMLPLVPM